MSRVAKRPVSVPKGVEISQSGGDLTVKGPKGELNMRLNSEVAVTIDTEGASVIPAFIDGQFAVTKSQPAVMMAK